jgi:phage tail-like protein
VSVDVSFSDEPNDQTIGTGPDAFLAIPDGATQVTTGIRLTAPPGGLGGKSQFVNMVELRLDEPGWIEDLPAIYRAPQGDPSAFLDPYLRLLRTASDDLESALLDLPSQFDPTTALDDIDGEPWLDWLATWVDVRLDERWDRSTRRSIVANAFRRHGERGTRIALQESIEVELNLRVSISEPGDQTTLWMLGDDTAELGIATMTAAGPSTGSIVDVTAVADRSHLIGPNEYGAPLFGDIAHRFDVRVHASQIQCEEDIKSLRALIDREKPAHTTAHLCITEPGISIGIQSRMDVDAVIGGATDPRAVSGLEGFQSARPGGRVALGDEGPLVLN